jgi:biopolymer transport protein ExbD
MKVSTSLAEINVVPLVDVMLVLLVIFMVAAPMMQQGFAVQLPQSRQSKAIAEPITVTVPASFRQDRRVRIGNDVVSLTALPERIKQALFGQAA